MATENISIAEAKQIDLVDLLEILGHKPEKVRNKDYWYRSPLRQEKTPSFKVNRQLNVWFDHGSGEGGNLVDFGIRYFKCSVAEFLHKLQNMRTKSFSFHPHPHSRAGEKKEDSNDMGKIVVLGSRNLADLRLLEYLESRKIPLSIARQFCEEVDFQLYSKKYTAIGFKNDRGGYELRNQYFKGSSTPKEPRLIRLSDSKDVAVFEGFFSFLSFQVLQKSTKKDLADLSNIQADTLILNSISFFEKSQELMEKYGTVHLFLDRDKMGMSKTEQALKWSGKYIDQSRHYSRYKDLNECLVKSVTPELKQKKSRGMRRTQRH